MGRKQGFIQHFISFDSLIVQMATPIELYMSSRVRKIFIPIGLDLLMNNFSVTKNGFLLSQWEQDPRLSRLMAPSSNPLKLFFRR